MLISILFFLPFLAIVSLWVLPLTITQSYKVTLSLSIANFIHTLILLHLYEANSSNFQFLLYFGDKIIAGLDGISLWLILLVNLITPIVILQSWRTQKTKIKNFLTLILSIGLLSILVFAVLDILLFYIAFEAILVPMYLLIGFYGSRNRKMEAKNMFFLYTLIGSLFLLLSLIVLIIETGTTDLEILLTLPINPNSQYLLFLGFFLALAIKMPMIPFHIWLPQAHTEAPTGGSVILAAILLKLGTFGFLRYAIPLFPQATILFTPLIVVMSLIGILYSCISALSLIDLKQIIAYSSIAHMNVSLIGLFSNDINGIIGCYLYSISHGFISAGLFLLVGILYERYHSRTLKYYGGLAPIMPLFAVALFLFTLSNISFPGTLSFIAEMFIYISSLTLSPFALIFLSFVSILLPIYVIWTMHKISFGSLSNYIGILAQDLTIKDFHLLLPLFILTIGYGIFPSYLIQFVELPL